jgi:hypothetical protein
MAASDAVEEAVGWLLILSAWKRAIALTVKIGRCGEYQYRR